jgi:hypothetical protein
MGAPRKINQPPAPRNLRVIEQLRLFVMANTAGLDRARISLRRVFPATAVALGAGLSVIWMAFWVLSARMIHCSSNLNHNFGSIIFLPARGASSRRIRFNNL